MATLSAISSDNDSEPCQPSPPSPEQPHGEEPHEHYNSHSQPSSYSQLLSLSFSRDGEFFSTCTRGGLAAVFRCDPFGEVDRHDAGGGVRTADTLYNYRPRLWAVVGDGSNPQFPDNKVFLWYCEQSRISCAIECRSPVRSVRIRRDVIVVVMERKAVVFQIFPDLRQLRSINTAPNPAGLCAVPDGAGEGAATEVLAFLGMKDGWIRVERRREMWESWIRAAHESKIACLGITQDGRFLATASAKGTLVRIFSTSGPLLQEVRRGVHRAEIHCLAFSQTAQWLAVSSDKGTVHVFSLKVNSSSNDQINKESQCPANPSTTLAAKATSSISSLAFIKGYLPKYLISPAERSVAKFRLPDASKSIVAFGHMKDTIIVLGMNGSFYRCQFDPVRGGNMTQLEHHNFLNP